MAQAPLPATIGRYVIKKRLGEGGMGSVYLAQDPVIDRPVAIKLLREGLENDELRERFAREARSAGRLRHNNIVLVFDVGEDEGRPFIAMEYVQGKTLADLVKQRVDMTVSYKLQLMQQLSEALGYAHLAGVIHRDIKPANLIVDDQGVLKILDFGIARLGKSGITMAGALMGTLNYMAPEQMLGKPVDSRSDIFAVGAVCYELLSYRRAFPGDLEDGILNRIINAQAEPLENFCRGLDPEILAIVKKALEKDPAQRYQDLATMSADLYRVRQRLDGPGTGQVVPSKAIGPVPTPHSGVGVAGIRTPHRTTDREQVARLRAQQIESQLAAARGAFESANYDGVFEACHQVLLLDPDNVTANDLLDRAKAVTEDRQVRECLKQAREFLASGDTDDVSRLIHEALSIHPTSKDAAEMQHLLEAVRHEREVAEARQRDLEAALERGRKALQRGDPQSAVRAADQALTIDDSHDEARAIRQSAIRQIDQLRQASEQRQAARVVEEATRRFEQGEHQVAIAMLEVFTPPNDQVTAALARMRKALAALEQRRRDEQQRAERVVAEARRRVDAGDAAGAVKMLEAHRPAHPLVEETVGRLRAELADLEARRKRQQQEAVRNAVDEATRRIAAGDRQAAITILEPFQTLSQTAAMMLADLRRQALENEQRQREQEARLARERGEAERQARVRADQERLSRERAEQERLAAQQRAEQERLARERAEQERQAAQQRAEQERLARERADQERLAAQQRAEQERLGRERADQERLAREQAERERVARELTERARVATERADQERLARERVAQDRLAQPRAVPPAPARAPHPDTVRDMPAARAGQAFRPVYLVIAAAALLLIAVPTVLVLRSGAPRTTPTPAPVAQETPTLAPTQPPPTVTPPPQPVTPAPQPPAERRPEPKKEDAYAKTGGPPPPPAPVVEAKGTLALTVSPWATVDVVRASDEGAVFSGMMCAPKCRAAQLPAGVYTVRTTRVPDGYQPLSFNITIAPGKVQTVNRALTETGAEADRNTAAAVPVEAGGDLRSRMGPPPARPKPRGERT